MILRNLIAMGTTVAGSCSAIYFCKHFLFIENYAQHAKLKENGVPVALTKNVNDLIATVMQDMNFKEDEMKLFHYIRVKGKDLNHFGYSGNEPGAYIAVPEIFAAEPGEMTNLNLIDERIFHLTENLDSIEKFKSLLNMPVEAKKFALAHELYKSGVISHYIYVIIPWMAASLLFLIFVIIYKINNTKMKSQPNLFMLHAIFTLCLLIAHFNRIGEVYKTNISDYQTAILGKEYIQGGISYYKNNIARNDFLLELYKNGSISKKIKCLNILYKHYTYPATSFLKRIQFLQEIQEADNVSEKKPNLWKIV